MNPKTSRIVIAVRVATCLALVSAFVLSEYFSFSGLGVTFLRPTWWAICAIGAVVFLATSASFRPRIAFGLAMLVCIVVGAYQLHYFLPLQHTVNQATFEDEPLPDILHAISKQRQTAPYRRFVICDTHTLNKRLTLSIPDGSTLSDTLEMITGETGCDYDWTWYSWCGNTYPPTTAKVYMFADGGTMTRGIWETNGRRLWRRDEGGILLTDRDGEVVPPRDEE